MSKLRARAGCVEDGKLTDIGCMHVLELTTLGFQLAEVAKYLRVTKQWLTERLDPDSDKFDERAHNAFNEGEHAWTKRLREAQGNLAEVNATMAIHLGKQYLGQRDKQEIEVTKTVHIVGTLPEVAQSPEQWLRQFGPGSQQPKRLDVVDAEAVEVGDASS